MNLLRGEAADGSPVHVDAASAVMDRLCAQVEQPSRTEAILLAIRHER
ncbi:MAG: hypothetical protein L0H84_16220 [Pseudonocardia sp.]|nr:hypothetical protein [Pseudonocardia sp.]